MGISIGLIHCQGTPAHRAKPSARTRFQIATAGKTEFPQCLERSWTSNCGAHISIRRWGRSWDCQGVRRRASTGRVSHVLAEKGVFFTDDRVVPIETIDHMEADRIVLSKEVDPAALPQFVREHFTQIDDETRTRLDVPAGYMWRYPATYAAPFPIYPSYPMSPGAPAGRT